MKCFQQLVLQHIKSFLTLTLDPIQFAYRSNCSSYNAISAALNSALTPGVAGQSCQNVVHRPAQHSTHHPKTAYSQTGQTGAQHCATGYWTSCQGDQKQCEFAATHPAPSLLTWAPPPFHSAVPNTGATPSLSLRLRRPWWVSSVTEMSHFAMWCSDNNLFLNVEKTKEIVVGFRSVETQHAPLIINSSTVELVSST